ncbi:MAG: hypothetical protein CMJ78_24745 [Planctomycetaceae bacterium]|nr:hypothetical protein [Planctomycetaceae bacterium]
MITLRTATLEDVDAMAAVEAQSWPSGMAADATTCCCRVSAYAEGQLVAVQDDEIVGVSSAQRITESHLKQASHSYNEVTDSNRFTASHSDDGAIYQLIGVSVLPRFRGLNLGRQLVDHQIDRARGMAGIERIIGFTRPAKHHEQAHVPMTTYISLHRASGMHVDPVIAFHLEAGARIVSLHEGFRPNDAESSGYGVLIEYPVR